MVLVLWQDEIVADSVSGSLVQQDDINTVIDDVCRTNDVSGHIRGTLNNMYRKVFNSFLVMKCTGSRNRRWGWSSHQVGNWIHGIWHLQRNMINSFLYNTYVLFLSHFLGKNKSGGYEKHIAWRRSSDTEPW